MNDLLVKLIESEYEGVGKITGTSGGNKLTGTGMITGFQFRPGYKVRLETSNNVWPVTAFGANDITITAGGGNPAFPSISGETKFYVRPSNDFLELVHDSIRIRMNSVNSAFTDIVNNLPAHLGNGKQDPDNSNFASYLGFFDKPANIYQAVGLYHGAEGYVSGGYHPTGTCMMRSSSADNDTAGDTVRGFCPVCRFAIVDIVDPTCHRANDAYIDLIYPKFK